MLLKYKRKIWEALFIKSNGPNLTTQDYILILSETHSEPSQMSEVELFVKVVTGVHWFCKSVHF